MNFGSVRSDRIKFWEGGLIFETNCIFEYKPSPHFRLDVVYKMGGGGGGGGGGGRINGTLRYIAEDQPQCPTLPRLSFFPVLRLGIV